MTTLSLTDVIKRALDQFPAEQLRMISARNIADWAGLDVVDPAFAAALQSLTQGGEPYLQLLVQYYDPMNDEEYEVEAEEVILARATGVLIHPDTGDEITDFEDNLMTFYAKS